MSRLPRLTRRTFLKSAAASTAALSMLGGRTMTGSASQTASDLTALTIAEVAPLIASRRVSPVELMQATLDRIATLEPRIGAFVTIVPELALEVAREAEREIMAGRYRGPLHGIPFGVKDTHYTRGILTTARTPVRADFRPDFDATVVVKLKEAGAILVGKLNLPEWSFGGATPGTHNPWDLSRTPGGSSGGSAAALAARMLAAATGGDTSGSIRQPALLNGVVGMKPTYGRVSRHGVVAISWTLDHVGPMTRTVEDNALLLNVLAGYDPQDPNSANVPVPDYTRALERGTHGVRIGIPERALLSRHHPDVLRAYDAALGVIAGLGATIQEVPMPASYPGMAPAHNIIRICEAASYHRPFLVADADRYGTGSNVRRDVEAGSLLTAAQYEQAQKVRARFTRELRVLFDTFDAWVMPGNAAPAGVEAPGSTGFDLDRMFNLTGFPSLAVPMGFSADPPGLPLGLQIAAAPFQEETIYALAQAYQMATDWHTRAPQL